MSNIPQKIKKLSVLAGISQAELARRVGMLPNHLNVFLQGKGDIHSARMVELLSELGIDVEELLDRKITAKLRGDVETSGVDLAVSGVIGKLRRMPRAEVQAISLIIGKISTERASKGKGRKREWHA